MASHSTNHAAGLVSGCLKWTAAQASVPVIGEIDHGGDSAVEFTNMLSGERFRLKVERVGRRDILGWFIAEHRRNPWMLPGVALTASAALGAVLPDLIELVGRLGR